MEYRLKNENFSTFTTYEKNKCRPRAYFIPFSQQKDAENIGLKEERYASDMVCCLSGKWDFAFYKDPRTLPDTINTDTLSWNKVDVPSCWQFTGYANPFYLNIRYPFAPTPPDIPLVEAEPYTYKGGLKGRIVPTDGFNSIGVYRTFFMVKNRKLTYKIAFLGVSSCMDLFVNGRFVGYSEGSHNTAEFALNDFVKEGRNEIVVAVHRWCNGSYLECQDMFRNNGIFRDVLLYELPGENINDYEIKTSRNEKDGTYNLSVEVQIENPKGGKVTFSLRIGDRVYSLKQKSASKITFLLTNLSVKEWSAEKPNLYTAVIGLNEKFFFRTFVGFRTIGICRAVYLWNDEPIKFLGVNHHDTTPDKGYVMTADEIERDILLLKKFNGNTIRTSHYPPDPLLTRLCAYYGVYVVEEADIETHGMAGSPLGSRGISHNLKWKNHYFDRMFRMVIRDRNLPCIAFWSMGNESDGLSCHDYCYKELKAITPIPIHYERARCWPRKGYDVYSTMYPMIPDMKLRHLFLTTNPILPDYHPYFLCEYAHAMGLGPGSLQEYRDVFESGKNFLGGCIWEWCDHAVLQPNGDYTYGGDHGEYVHDGNFCVDGLFYPDRTPSRSAYEMKNAYRPVMAKYTEKGLVFTNYMFFTYTGNILFEVTVRQNDTAVFTRDYELFIQPRDSKTIPLSVPEYDCSDILIRYLDKETKEEIASETIVLSRKFPAHPPLLSQGKTEVREEGTIIVVTGAEWEYLFDKDTCTFVSMKKGGYEYVNQSPTNRHNLKGSYTELYRAGIDNDNFMENIYKKTGLRDFRIKGKFLSVHKKGNTVVFTVKFKYLSNQKIASEKDTVLVYEDGTVQYNIEFTPYFIYGLPRIGKVFEWSKDFIRNEWTGYGPGESNNDFHCGTTIGTYSEDISCNEPYIKPQHTGTRYGTSRAEISTADGRTVTFSALSDPFLWTAKHYTENDLLAWKHRSDVRQNETAVTTVDGFFRGIGSQSCGPFPRVRYCLKGFGTYRYRFAFRMK